MRYPAAYQLQRSVSSPTRRHRTDRARPCDDRPRLSHRLKCPRQEASTGHQQQSDLRHTGDGCGLTCRSGSLTPVPKLLIIHHTPSPNMQAMFEAVVAGATTEEIEDVEVVRKPALSATPADALEADGYILGTPANLGMMSGALKVFFDNAYYPCLDATRGRPYGLYIHGNNDTAGAVRGIESITTGLGWTKSGDNVSVTAEPDKTDIEACWNLGATIAAGLMP